MLTPMVAGGVVFPGLFLLSKNTLQRLPQLRWEEADAVIVSARLVSSVQAIMASTAGYIVSTSCKHIIDDVWRQGKGDFFLGCMLMAEVSTPFVCLGKILIQYKQQHTLLHKVNGALMLLSFLCCRVLLFPYLYWAYGRHAGLPLLAVPLAIPAHVNLGAALLLAPQLYWFFLICRGACRLFWPRSRPPPACPAHD
ncbi:Protein FAM57B, partial [Macaca fascicularis]